MFSLDLLNLTFGFGIYFYFGVFDSELDFVYFGFSSLTSKLISKWIFGSFFMLKSSLSFILSY